MASDSYGRFTFAEPKSIRRRRFATPANQLSCAVNARIFHRRIPGRLSSKKSRFWLNKIRDWPGKKLWLV